MDREALLNALLDFFLGEEDAPGLPGPLPEEYRRAGDDCCAL